MRHPLVIVALLYTCGLMLAEIVTPPLIQLLATGLALALLALFWERMRCWLLVPLVIVVGWANLTSRTAILSPADLRNHLTSEPVEVALRGSLTETPSVRMFIRDETESYRTLAVVEVKELWRDGRWIPAFGQVMTTTPGNLDGKMFNGTEVEVHGIIALPTEPAAPGLFNYRSYLARQGIYFHLKPASETAWTPQGRVEPGLADRFLAWAHLTLSRGLPEEDLSLRLLFAMTLGWKTGLTSEVYEPFMLSGTMHVFAISGLHIALIAALLVAVLRVIRIPRQWCGLIVIPLIWFYTGATGWQPSAIRSTIMMTVIIGGWSLRRPSNLLNSLAVAGLVILVWQPQQLFQASFQLSFFVVLSIALLLPPLQTFGDQLIAHDPLLPREVLSRWQRILHTALRWLMTSLATSLAAWLGSLPLTIQYFHIFSPVTLLANLVIVPLSSVALACNLGSMLCGEWLPAAGELFNHSAWLCMTCMVGLSKWSTTLPWAFTHVASPPAWSFVAYYVLLIAMLSGWLFRKENRPWAMLAVTIVLAGSGMEWREARRSTLITVLPLNGGHAVYLDALGRTGDWLIDCGNTNSAEFVTKPFLYAQGADTLANMALTHGDLQQVGGMQMMRETFPMNTIYTSPVKFRSAVYRSIMSDLEAAPGISQTISSGQDAGCWKVLHPAADDKFAKGDDGSLVMLGDFHGTRVLLLGDLGRPGQELLLRRTSDLRADIVVTGLPEEGEALSDGLIDAVQPKLVVIADSEFPATKRARRPLKDRLEKRGLTVIYMRTARAVSLKTNPDGWVLRTMSGVELRAAPRLMTERSQNQPGTPVM